MLEYEISWIVVLSIGTLVGLFLAVGNPIIKLNSTITKLMTRLTAIESNIDKFTVSNKDSHRRIHERIDEVEDNLSEVKEDVERLKYSQK
jgi:predicted PurR-regulated permease PerM